MVGQVIAALLTWLIFTALAKKVKDGKHAKGRFWNFWESIVLYLRDEVVRPTIGEEHHHHHDEHGHQHGHIESGSEDVGETSPAQIAPSGHVVAGNALALEGGHAHRADKYLPFILTCFFYILFCNLLGAIPSLGSPTGNISVTGVLAFFAFCFTLYCGFEESGFSGYWKSLVPTMDLPGPIGLVIKPLIWFLEFVGLLVKHTVLAIRLFANIMAGHTVISVILGFIAITAGGALWYVVTPASIFGQLLIGVLELFVAFLQAYVFAFLATLFVSAAVNPH